VQYLLVDSKADLQGRLCYSKQKIVMVYPGFLHSSSLGNLSSLYFTRKTVVGLQTVDKRLYRAYTKEWCGFKS
jgi:hypothetical protein